MVSKRISVDLFGTTPKLKRFGIIHRTGWPNLGRLGGSETTTQWSEEGFNSPALDQI